MLRQSSVLVRISKDFCYVFYFYHHHFHTRHAHAWILKIDPVQIISTYVFMCVCMYVCIRAQGY